MASKIVVFVLVVTICKVQSQKIYYSNPQHHESSSASSNAKSSAAAPSDAHQLANALSNTGPVLFPGEPSNPHQGIKASPQLKIVPGQGCNLQAIPMSQFRGPIQQSQNQNYMFSIPRPVMQTPPSPQIQTSPAQLIQPTCSGPSSVITGPVSTINIPPTGVTTIIDNSLSNSLANALQMMIANEFINSAINNNIINHECIRIPVVETVAPTFDLSTFLQGLNTQQTHGIPTLNPCDQTPLIDPTPPIDTCQPHFDQNQYDWTTIQNFLNKPTQEEKPVHEVAPTTPTTLPTTDMTSLLSYFQQHGQTADQTTHQASKYSPNPIPQPANPEHTSYNSALETIAAYLGCNVSDVSSNTYPTVPQFKFPEEIPAQLICNYGYMPTTVPVVSFSVQPLGGDSCNNFIVGCPCPC